MLVHVVADLTYITVRSWSFTLSDYDPRHILARVTAIILYATSVIVTCY